MIYRIRQDTTYRYAASVPFARHLLRLTPGSDDGQTVLSSVVTVTPAPYETGETVDFFGNRVIHVGIETPHLTMSVASTAEVRVESGTGCGRPPPEPDSTPAWEAVRDAALRAGPAPRSPVHQLFASRLVAPDPAIGAYAAASFPPGRPVLAGGMDLTARIHRDFAYDPAATDVTTPPAEAFALRRGVCQDFAHVMIAGLRALALPAAYVSGYLRTRPAPGHRRLEGADATHAWVALWCGPEAGWQGLDPTNAMRAGGEHIPLAFGRDYADAAPVDGVIVAAGGHFLSVQVDVACLDEASGSAGAAMPVGAPVEKA